MSSNVIARLTVTRQNGIRSIFEIHEDATFHHFYKVFQQNGSKRSTKALVRTASRNEGLNPVNAHLQTPGLEFMAVRLMHLQAESNPVVSTRIRYFSKRAYRKMITCAPDQLGLTKVNVLFGTQPTYTFQPIGIALSFKPVESLNHHKLHAGSR